MFKANPEKYADADVAMKGFCPSAVRALASQTTARRRAKKLSIAEIVNVIDSN